MHMSKTQHAVQACVNVARGAVDAGRVNRLSCQAARKAGTTQSMHARMDDLGTELVAVPTCAITFRTLVLERRAHAAVMLRVTGHS